MRNLKNANGRQSAALTNCKQIACSHFVCALGSHAVQLYRSRFAHLLGQSPARHQSRELKEDVETHLAGAEEQLRKESESKSSRLAEEQRESKRRNKQRETTT